VKLPLVYFIQNTQGHLKIGYSGVLNNRFGQVTPSSPYPCDLVATYFHSEARKIEGILHKILDDVRLAGEWFSCSLERAMLAIPMACAALKKATRKRWKLSSDEKCATQHFKERLRYLVENEKEKNGTTQREISAAIGVSHERFNKWVTTPSEPSIEHLSAIVELFDTDFNWLFGKSP